MALEIPVWLTSEQSVKLAGTLVSLITPLLFGKKAAQKLRSPRSQLAHDLDILKNLPADSPSRQIVQNRIDENILKIYDPDRAKAVRKAAHMAQSGEKRAKVDTAMDIVRPVLAFLFLSFWVGLTWYVVRDGFSWWALLTGFVAFMGLGMFSAALTRDPRESLAPPKGGLPPARSGNPPSTHAKRLVVCIDGASIKAGPTNMYKVAHAVAPSSGMPQMTFYDADSTSRGRLSFLVQAPRAAGIDKSIQQAYSWVAKNYAPGDEIFLFGFARGAFVARGLTGMIERCGILKDPTQSRVLGAYHHYRSSRHSDSPAARAFRDTQSVESTTTIQFLGVLETVGPPGILESPLGFLGSRHHQFHDTSLSPIVRHACHGLAIDERRQSLKPILWTNVTPMPGQTIKQVWFAGHHGDIGGTAGQTGLSDVVLAWLIQEASEAGLEFDQDYLKKHLRPDPVAPMTDSPQQQGLLRETWRPIGGSDGQLVHTSVLQRKERIGYNPPNLEKTEVDQMANYQSSSSSATK